MKTLIDFILYKLSGGAKGSWVNANNQNANTMLQRITSDFNLNVSTAYSNTTFIISENEPPNPTLLSYAAQTPSGSDADQAQVIYVSGIQLPAVTTTNQSAASAFFSIPGVTAAPVTSDISLSDTVSGPFPIKLSYNLGLNLNDNYSRGQLVTSKLDIMPTLWQAGSTNLTGDLTGSQISSGIQPSSFSRSGLRQLVGSTRGNTVFTSIKHMVSSIQLGGPDVNNFSSYGSAAPGTPGQSVANVSFTSTQLSQADTANSINPPGLPIINYTQMELYLYRGSVAVMANVIVNCGSLQGQSLYLTLIAWYGYNDGNGNLKMIGVAASSLSLYLPTDGFDVTGSMNITLPNPFDYQAVVNGEQIPCFFIGISAYGQSSTEASLLNLGFMVINMFVEYNQGPLPGFDNKTMVIVENYDGPLTVQRDASYAVVPTAAQASLLNNYSRLTYDIDFISKAMSCSTYFTGGSYGFLGTNAEISDFIDKLSPEMLEHIDWVIPMGISPMAVYRSPPRVLNWDTKPEEQHFFASKWRDIHRKIGRTLDTVKDVVRKVDNGVRTAKDLYDVYNGSASGTHEAFYSSGAHKAYYAKGCEEPDYYCMDSNMSTSGRVVVHPKRTPYHPTLATTVKSERNIALLNNYLDDKGWDGTPEHFRMFVDHHKDRRNYILPHAKSSSERYDVLRKISRNLIRRRSLVTPYEYAIVTRFCNTEGRVMVDSVSTLLSVLRKLGLTNKDLQLLDLDPVVVAEKVYYASSFGGVDEDELDEDEDSNTYTFGAGQPSANSAIAEESDEAIRHLNERARINSSSALGLDPISPDWLLSNNPKIESLLAARRAGKVGKQAAVDAANFPILSPTTDERGPVDEMYIATIFVTTTPFSYRGGSMYHATQIRGKHYVFIVDSSFDLDDKSVIDQFAVINKYFDDKGYTGRYYITIGDDVAVKKNGLKGPSFGMALVAACLGLPCGPVLTGQLMPNGGFAKIGDFQQKLQACERNQLPLLAPLGNLMTEIEDFKDIDPFAPSALKAYPVRDMTQLLVYYISGQFENWLRMHSDKRRELEANNEKSALSDVLNKRMSLLTQIERTIRNPTWNSFRTTYESYAGTQEAAKYLDSVLAEMDRTDPAWGPITGLRRTYEKKSAPVTNGNPLYTQAVKDLATVKNEFVGRVPDKDGNILYLVETNGAKWTGAPEIISALNIDPRFSSMFQGTERTYMINGESRKLFFPNFVRAPPVAKPPKQKVKSVSILDKYLK